MSYTPVNYELLTPVNFVKRSAEVYPDKLAIVNGKDRFTYKEFNERVNRLASALINLGIHQGDKVAFVSPNIPPMLEAHFAIPMIGAVLVSVNTRLSAQEVAYILNHSESIICFVDNELSDMVLPVLNQITTVKTFINICDTSDACPLDGTDYESFLGTGSIDDVAITVADERDNVTINYTSGTTGQPKGVMYHHRGAYLNSLGNCIEMGMRSDSVYLWTLPMFHCNGWCFPWAVTAAGAVHVCLRKVDPTEIIEMFKKENVSHMCAAPVVLIGIVNHPESKNISLKRPLEILVGGAPPSPTLIEQLGKIGANVTHGYGLTEVYGPYTICAWHEEWNELPTDEQAAIRSRQGVANVVCQFLDVLDTVNNKPVPRDGKTIGEVVMRGNVVMLGYYNDQDATEKAFTGGWFHSGDLAVMHPDNYIQIMDRQKDIIISGGENISTVEVENVIYRHPDVLEVAVVSMPDEKWGEVPKAFITVKEGTQPTAQEIIDFCKANMARFKAPKMIEFIELPKTSTGKIQKYVLRDKEWSNRTKRIN